MPFAIIKRVREVSSEDSTHVAVNLLQSQADKKWKTKNFGEKSAFVVLELDEPCEITGIDIGNEHSAFIEVLVGNAGSSQDEFSEILITCSFMTPFESKNSSNINRVRCFGKEALVESKLTSKWKLIKVICSQPFNKYVQYGLSFIKIHISDKPNKIELLPNALDRDNLKRKAHTIRNQCEKEDEKVKKQNVGLGKFSLREDSPESDSESASGLFNRWKTSRIINMNGSPTIASAIREASKPAICAESSLRKTDNNALLPPIKNKPLHNKKSDKLPENRHKLNDLKKGQEKQNEDSKKETEKSVSTRIEQKNSSTVTKTKRKQSMNMQPFNKLLQGVVLVISGIQNPQRANLRSKALAMGAKYKGDWESCCTHLICAFKNTPKYNQVKGKGKIVTSKWIEKCYELKKYLPWRRFALDNEEFNKPESDEEIFDESQKQTASEDNWEKDEVKPQPSGSNFLKVTNELNETPIEVKKSSSGSDTDDDIQRAVTKNLQNLVKNNSEYTPNKDNLSNNCDSVYEVLTEEEDFLKDKFG